MKSLAPILGFLAIALLPSAAGAEETEVVLTDYAYYVNGTRSEDYKPFADHFEKHRASTVSIYACTCLNTRRLIEFMDWLRGLGVTKVALAAIDQQVEDSLCGECD